MLDRGGTEQYMKLIVGSYVMLMQDVYSNIGYNLLIPKFTKCEVVAYNNSMVKLKVGTTNKIETIRNNANRKNKIVPYTTNIELVKLLYE